METPSSDEGNLAARVASAPVLDLEGREVRLGSLWRQPTVNVFVRHFGCLFCHQMVADIVEAMPTIQGLGARVLIVGNGSVGQAKHFASDKGLTQQGLVLVTDPDRSSYQAWSLQRGLGKTFSKDARRAYGRARRRGHEITGLFGDLTQLGGVLVVKPPALVVYRHRSRFAGDHPKIPDVLAAVRSAVSGAAQSG